MRRAPYAAGTPVPTTRAMLRADTRHATFTYAPTCITFRAARVVGGPFLHGDSVR